MISKPNKRLVRWLEFQIEALGCFTLFLLSFAPSAWSQLNYSSGTVVVFRWHKNKITVAADSRVTDPSTGTYRNDDCKIATIGDKTFFVSSGMRHFEAEATGGFQLDWDSHEVARRAFKASHRGTSKAGDIRAVATNWAMTATKMFNTIPAKYREEFGNLVFLKSGAPVILFAGLEENGEIDAYLASITYKGGIFTPNAMRAPIDRVISFGAGNTMVLEFNQSMTERAKNETRRWNSSAENKTADERDSEWIVKLVDWVIAYDQSGKVGGKTQAVELRQGGTVHWIQPCPKN
jgi:hypothetical protein